MKISYFFILLFLYGFTSSKAQECATPLLKVQTDFMNETRAARAAIDLDQFDQVNIPILAHIVRRSDGTGGLSTADLDTSIEQLNDNYTQLNMVFELCGINYIDDDSYHDNNLSYSTTEGSDEYNLAIPNREQDKVNIFFLPNIGACGWSSFPSYLAAFDKDWTIMNNVCATNGSTLAHEIGHFFNLYHTHQSISSGIGITAAELVDGSNCGDNVGDELCDTPADPVLSGCVNYNCVYTCTDTDANGDAYVPDPTNIMSYSRKECRTFFSQQQRDRILTSYALDRSNLATFCANCPNLILMGTTSATISYNAESTILSTQVITSSGMVDYRAGQSIILSSGFRANQGAEFTARNEACSPGLMENGNNGQQTSRIATSALEITETKQPKAADFRCYPNPFSQLTTIEYTLSNDAPVTLSITDITGRLVQQLANKAQLKGSHQLEFDGSNLTPGVYFARLQSNSQVQTIKLIIQR